MPKISLEAVRVNAGYNQKECSVFPIVQLLTGKKERQNQHYHNLEK